MMTAEQHSAELQMESLREYEKIVQEYPGLVTDRTTLLGETMFQWGWVRGYAAALNRAGKILEGDKT